MPLPSGGNIAIPAIETIANPKKTRIALVQGPQLVSAPATAISDALGLPAGGTTGQVLTKTSDDDYDTEWGDIPAQGDVSGPASATDSNFAAFDGTTGKLIKDSSKSSSSFATASQGAKADTAVQPGSLAAVATSGAYSDLTGTPTQREVLTAARTYYFRTDGSDSNDGLANSSGGAFLTVQKALDVVLGTLDLGGFNITIQGAAGTYTGAISFASPQVGSGNITINGDTTTPSNVTVGPITVDGAGCRLFISGINVDKGTGQFCLEAQNGGYIQTVTKNQFSSTSGGHRMFARLNGTIQAIAPEIIQGTCAGGHYRADMNGVIFCQSATWTASGTATSGYFAGAANGGVIYAFANSSSGTFSGQRYSASTNGVIQSNGGGASYFPGSTAGATATGGQYA